MNATIITAAEIVNELAEMFPVDEPGQSTPDRIVANKLAELAGMLADEIASYERHLAARWEAMQDARFDAISAHWGHD